MDTTELQNQAIEIRDAENEGENTALRVGTMLLAIIEALSNIVDTDTLQQVLADYASLSGTGIVNWRQSRCVLLDSMGANLDNIDGGNWEYVSHNGDIIYNPSGKNLRVVGEQGNYSVLRGVIYINAHSCHAYKWDVVAQDMVEIVDSSSPAVITYRNAPAFADIPIGASYFFYSSSGYKIGIKTTAHDAYSFDPDPKKIYAFVDTRQTAVWNASNQTWIPIGNSVEIVDNLTEGGRNKSLSAEQGKILNQRISESQQHLQGLVDDMDAAEASSAVSAPSARIVKEIYINLKKLFDPGTGLANIAFLGTRPTWESVNKRKFNLVMNASTLTGCTGTVVSGDAGNGQVYEGSVRIKLTPTQASYAFTSVTVNGNNVTTTSAEDGLGSVFVDIVVNDNITVAATAVSGRGITFNGTGCSIGAAGVAINQDLDTTITANEHYTLPSSITVKIGNTNVAHTYTRAQDNKTATLHIDAANITGDLTITCTADEDAHVTLAISGSNFVVKQGNTQLSNGSKVYNGSAAQTLTIEPASGYKFSTLPSADKGTMTNNGPYEASSLEIGTSVSGTLTITAAATELQQYSITLPSDTRIDMTNDTTSILEGSSYTNVLSLNGTAGADDTLYNVGATMAGGGSISTNNNTIHTDCVTGNITINASVGEVIIPAKVHSYSFPAITDNSGECLEDTVNNFNLYLYNDSTKSAFANGYTNVYSYPIGSYCNGVQDTYRNGKAGDGDRVIKVSEFGDFTLVIKNIRPILDSSGKVNNNEQKTIKLHDRTNVAYQANDWPSSNPVQRTGQFELYFSHTSGYYLAQSGKLVVNIRYCSAGATAASYRFADAGASFPYSTIEKGGETIDAHTYHFVVAYNATSLKVSVWLVDIDNSTDTATFSLSGELTVDTALRLPCISVPDSTQVGALDVYNYAMDETAIADEFNATLNTVE